MSTLTQNKFTKEWWDDFLDNTDSLKKTNVFSDCMPHDETEEMRAGVLDIIRLIIKNKAPNYGFRLFIEGKTLTEKELELFFETSIPEEGETFEDWSDRCFGDKKYGIIINRGEKFNPSLVEQIAKKIQPLVSSVGIPRLGVTFTIFIGNYGWTPLGIHTDGIGENVMHFHLGKGNKTMYTWDRNTYDQLVEPEKRFNNTNIEEILDHANVFDFANGDIYFMPYGEYHVGKSDDLSIGLTLWFNNHTKTALFKKIMDNFLTENVNESVDILPMDLSGYDELNNFNDIEDLFIGENLSELSFVDLLKDAYRDYKIALYSNCGFWESPFPKAKKVDHSQDFNVQIVQPFKILYYQDELLHLFIRGKKINMNSNDSFLNLIEELNKGSKLNKMEIFDVLDDSWDHSIKEYVIDLLNEHHIINVEYV
ncbi:hypothetical protein [Chryseobacterium sp. c4a]|uniref:hypothetical protein n=1 Tax=Chryseobacterium sp. c4a TaxID=1573582 RepID=UPI001359A7FC|nr:hypothetical protein [Chryseobacterium sp. c4a]